MLNKFKIIERSCIVLIEIVRLILLLLIINKIINTVKFIFSKVFKLRRCLFNINFAQSNLFAKQFSLVQIWILVFLIYITQMIAIILVML